MLPSPQSKVYVTISGEEPLLTSTVVRVPMKPGVSSGERAMPKGSALATGMPTASTTASARNDEASLFID